MIYKKEEYIEEAGEKEKFFLKQIEVLTPLDSGTSRYFGHITLGIQTPMGVQQIPVSFEIDAGTIREAFQRFEQCAEPKIEETRKSIEEEIQRLRQEAAGRIIKPGDIAMGGTGNIMDFNKFKK